jgi:hypothetical protein
MMCALFMLIMSYSFLIGDKVTNIKTIYCSSPNIKEHLERLHIVIMQAAPETQEGIWKFTFVFDNLRNKIY